MKPKTRQFYIRFSLWGRFEGSGLLDISRKIGRRIGETNKKTRYLGTGFEYKNVKMIT